MSLKTNTIANYFGQGYNSIIGIVILPLYLKYLGAEAYGLVGFYTALQAWLTLVDLGMSPTLSREVAHCFGSSSNLANLKRLVYSLEIIFFVVSSTICMSIFFSSHWISTSWFKVQKLNVRDITYCVSLMAFMVGLRLLSSLQRSGIRGTEEQVWLNIANSAINTLRFVGGYLLLAFITRNPRHYFESQLAVAVLELFVLYTKFHRSITSTLRVKVRFYWRSVKPIIPFATGIAYTTGVWILITQLDKLILSNVLKLNEYGYFALVATMSTGILNISTPLSQALLPRMTNLFAQGKMEELYRLYRDSSQLMAVIMISLVAVISVFSNEVFFAWTGDMKAANWAGPILTWYCLGNGILSLGAFQYYLQFTFGKLRMHVIYNTINACVQVPLIIYVAYKYQAIGAALSWFIFRSISFLVYSPIVHKKFAPGIHLKWLAHDIGLPSVMAGVATLILYFAISFNHNSRIQSFIFLFVITITVMAFSSLGSRYVRRKIFSFIKR